MRAARVSSALLARPDTDATGPGKGVYKLLTLPPPPGGYPGCTRQGIGKAPPSPDPTL